MHYLRKMEDEEEWLTDDPHISIGKKPTNFEVEDYSKNSVQLCIIQSCKGFSSRPRETFKSCQLFHLTFCQRSSLTMELKQNLSGHKISNHNHRCEEKSQEGDKGEERENYVKSLKRPIFPLEW